MKKIVNLIFGVVIIFGISILLLFLFGIKSYRVISDSMSPKIYKNALAFVSIYDDQELQENDIIAFNFGDKLVLHRIVEIDGDTIITKGDANDAFDSPIKSKNVIGIYIFSIPLIGILFASVYPWVIIALLIISYIVTKQLVIEFKKKK